MQLGGSRNRERLASKAQVGLLNGIASDVLTREGGVGRLPAGGKVR